MKKLLFLISTFTIFTTLKAQKSTDISITSGPAYTKQSFYTLSNDAISTNANADWDMAFTVYNFQLAGIFINEATGIGAEKPVRLYKAPTNNFNDNIKESQLVDSLGNNENDWVYGAFNADRSPSSPFDYGWGKYDSSKKEVVGNKVFVVRLRNNTLRKVEIQKFSVVTGYTVRHAKLDGSDEKTIDVNPSNFKNKTLAYLSLGTNTTKDLEPANYDLLFTRYVSTVSQGGITQPYGVLGILLGRDIQAAKASGIDPLTVKYNEYDNKYSKKIDTIGHDWKSVDINTLKWTCKDDVAYFVKARDKSIYKIVFFDFQGSGTGTASFEKTLVSSTTNNNDISKDVDFKVFPTAATSELNVAFDNKNSEQFDIAITDMMGRTVAQYNADIQSGFQVKTLPISTLANGTYVLSLKSNKGIATAKFVKF